MLPRSVALLSCALGLPLPLRADWVKLEDGRVLRGIDFQQRGNLRIFLLEDGREIYLDPAAVVSVQKSGPDEKVELRGRAVSLREKVLALRKEARKEEKAAVQAVERWSVGGREAEAARERFETLPGEERQRILALTLARSREAAARSLAGKGLAAFKDGLARAALSNAVVGDPSRDVRVECFRALESIAEATTGEIFVDFLRSGSQAARVRAAGALQRFPTPRGVPVLISALKKAWDGFGRASVFQGTTRAYIKDYNLVSGGTGFSLIEVADPEIGRVSTGVVLDVDVRRVEVIAYVRALEEATGQALGADPRRWERWWRGNAPAERPSERSNE